MVVQVAFKKYVNEGQMLSQRADNADTTKRSIFPLYFTTISEGHFLDPRWRWRAVEGEFQSEQKISEKVNGGQIV
jgi:hypothetical protein